MAKITFSVDMKTGKATTLIEGETETGCVPIHAQINADLDRVLKLTPATSNDTGEYERPPTVAATMQQSIGW